MPKQPDKPLSTIFATMEQHKEQLHLQEYALSQTSLEDIFNQFAAEQEEERGVIRGTGNAVKMS